MGKKIDAFVLTVAATGGLYLYFLGAVKNRVVALLLALLCCAALGKLLKRLAAALSGCRFARRRRVRRCAGGAVMRLACMEDAEARERLSNLLRASYGADCPLELIALHPSCRLPRERLFDAWRAHRGEDKLAVCATCPADADCRALAATLKSPRVALVDAGMLRQLIAERPEGFDCGEAASAPRRAKLLPRLRRAWALLVNRRNAPRGLLFAAAMFAMYALGGSLAYLIAAMALLFLALASLRRPARPARLF